MTDENPHSGQGPVILDIGGEVGALVVVMPHGMIGLEVEIVPTGTADDYPHRQHPAHTHDEGHGHGHGHTHDDGGALPPHVAVVARPVPSGAVIPSLVYGSLVEGTYDLYVRPDGPVRLTAEVRGGEVTEATWPTP